MYITTIFRKNSGKIFRILMIRQISFNILPTIFIASQYYKSTNLPGILHWLTICIPKEKKMNFLYFISLYIYLLSFIKKNNAKSVKDKYSYLIIFYFFFLFTTAKCFKKYEGWYLKKQGVEERYVNAEEDCKILCLSSIYRCKSCQFDTITKLCSLSMHTEETKPNFFTQNSNYIYWKRRRNCNLSTNYYHYYYQN